MKYAIISDIHANPAALERVLVDAERCGAEKVVCAGDVVGYGPDPVGAIRILRERGIPTVMGNHDAAVSGWHNTDGMIDTAREGTERHRRELGEPDLDWLRALPQVKGVGTTFSANAPQLYFVADRDKALALGVSVSDIFATMQNQLASFYVNDFNYAGGAHQVLVQNGLGRGRHGHALSGTWRRDGADNFNRTVRARAWTADDPALQQNAGRGAHHHSGGRRHVAGDSRHRRAQSTES